MAVILSHSVYNLGVIVSLITIFLLQLLPTHSAHIPQKKLQFSLAEASMESELGPKTAQKIFEGEGGSYSSWSSADFPILSLAKVGAGTLVLEPLGYALPHYADSTKIGFVAQGKGRLGLIFPKDSEQKVVVIEEGDVIPVPLATVSWWFNDGNSKLVVVFLADTSMAYLPGNIIYFLLAGAQGIFTGFSTDFVSRACDLDEEDTNKLVKNQPGLFIIKLNEGTNLPQPSKANKQEVIFSTEAALPDIDVKNGGQVVVVSVEKFPILGEVGLSGKHVRLDANAMYSPEFSSDDAVQMVYIVKGSGRVQVVGILSERVLDVTVMEGDLFVVPRIFVVSTIAGSEGMEWFAMTTTTQPFFSYLVGKTSLFNSLSPQVIQVSLNLTLEDANAFSLKFSNNSILIPGPV